MELIDEEPPEWMGKDRQASPATPVPLDASSFQ